MCHTQYNQVHIFGILRKIWFISGDFSVHFDINLGYGDCAFGGEGVRKAVTYFTL